MKILVLSVILALIARRQRTADDTSVNYLSKKDVCLHVSRSARVGQPENFIARVLVGYYKCTTDESRRN